MHMSPYRFPGTLRKTWPIAFSQVQNNKQLLSSLHKKSRDRTSIEPYKIPTDITSRINAKWSNEELLLGVQGNAVYD